MSATATPVPPRSDRLRPRRQPLSPPSAAPAPRPGSPPPAPAREARGGRVLFEVPFKSAMTDADLARLARTFDLSTHMYAKLPSDPTTPGVVRLDDFSGLFLQRGASEGEWVLQARTWGQPAPASAHEWHVLAAGGAHELDSSVTTPKRLPPGPKAVPADRPVGAALNRRSAAFRRRLVGLS